MSSHVISLENSEGSDTYPDRALPAFITKRASKQTYYTIRFLVDRERVADAYRAYAYFRWVDDQLDENGLAGRARRIFIARQQALIDCFQWSDGTDLCAFAPNPTWEERMVVELFRTDQEPASGLHSYIQNMMAVMAFDAERRGRLISQDELTAYTRHLATAVTDAVYYFIGHDQPCPQDNARYLPTVAAHIVHMLRDTREDLAAGYFNVPCEFLEAYHLDPCDIDNDHFRLWTRQQVQLARDYFTIGKRRLAETKNWRRRIAGYAYIARFECVLNTIEQEDYRLRPSYHELKNVWSGLRMGWAVLSPLLSKRQQTSYTLQNS